MKKTLAFLLLCLLPGILSAQHLLIEFSKCRLVNNIYLDHDSGKCNCNDTITVGYFAYITQFKEGKIYSQIGSYIANGANHEEMYFDSAGKITDTITKFYYETGQLGGYKHWVYQNGRSYYDKMYRYNKTGKPISSEQFNSSGQRNGVCEYWLVNDTFHFVEHYEAGALRMKILFNKNEELLWISFLDNSIDGVSSIEFMQHDLMKITYYNGNDIIYSEKRKFKLKKSRKK